MLYYFGFWPFIPLFMKVPMVDYWEICHWYVSAITFHAPKCFIWCKFEDGDEQHFFAVKLMPDNTCHYGRSGGYLVTFNHFISFSLALVKGKQWSFLLRDSVDNHLVCTNILLYGPNLQPFTWLSSETHGSEIWLTGTVPKALTQGIIFGLRIQILRI